LEDAAFNLVAELGGAPSGMASGMAWGEGGCELTSMWVAPPARGHGVGGALVDAFLAKATALGRREVRLSVKVGNDHARALYLRYGFCDAGENDEDVAPGEPRERWMTRTLAFRAAPEI
jgi:ribosomal protein S18 acetylase RimI-like enzyme